MGIGTSLVLIAAGAILRYAVTANVSGVDLDVVGIILMALGAVGLVLSMLWLAIWSDRRRGTVVPAGAVVADDPDPRRRAVVERDVV